VCAAMDGIGLLLTEVRTPPPSVTRPLDNLTFFFFIIMSIFSILFSIALFFNECFTTLICCDYFFVFIYTVDVHVYPLCMVNVRVGARRPTVTALA
jgi:hypothetical protein